jgi:hypothetical protein
MKLEDELRRALAPEEPPKGFSARVRAKIDAQKWRSPVMPIARHRVIGMAMAATIAIGAGSTMYYAHRRQLAEGERVRSEAVTGLRIASAKLNDVHERLLRISSQSQRSR